MLDTFTDSNTYSNTMGSTTRFALLHQLIFRIRCRVFAKRAHRFLSLAATVFISVFLSVLPPVNSAYSQTSDELADKKRLASVLAVVSNMLLEESDRNLFLDINGFEQNSRTVTDALEVALDTQGQDVEFCFYLSATQALTAQNFNLSINGVPQTGVNSAAIGENCYTLPLSQQSNSNSVTLSVQKGFAVTVRDIGLEPSNQARLGLPVLTRSNWDDAAVRKVLRIFAFGGHATDAQITTWANMRPRAAIAQMLNFSKHNLRLSPLSPGETYRQTATQYGELKSFAENFLSNPASNLPISVGSREKFRPDGGYAFDDVLSYMITTRGLNPFRQMVGFWETNYHLAVNLDSSANAQDMVAFYDIIMNAHESGLPYQRVLALAAKATAVTAQYGHNDNEWIDGSCFCNQDFAREIHQLYFGIFGEGDEEHHENVTIPNTAAMLTGMKIYDRVPNPDKPGRFRYERRYEPRLELDKHHQRSLSILRKTVSGSTPLVKIDRLVEFSIEHPDSLFNLPIMIIEGIADDNLNENRKNQLRAAWASMGSNKQFLTFIQSYAMSEMFHSTSQRKYMSSFWRTFHFANKFNQYNIESIQAGRDGGRMGRPIDNILADDGVQVFRPTNNVFGGQTSLEASDSAKIFEDNYNRSAADGYRWNKVECSDCDQGSPWVKDWSSIIPARNGGHTTDHVARWLWRHLFGNYKNYTELERAHLVSILGATLNNENRHFDLTMMLCLYNDRVEQGETDNSVSAIIDRSWRYCRQDDGNYSTNEQRWLNKAYSTQEITNTLSAPYTGPYNPVISDGAIPSIVQQLSQIQMPFKSSDEDKRREANRRVHYALAFLRGLPFTFVEAGE